MESLKTPTYNSWCVLYKDNKIIGYVHTPEEADESVKLFLFMGLWIKYLQVLKKGIKYIIKLIRFI